MATMQMQQGDEVKSAYPGIHELQNIIGGYIEEAEAVLRVWKKRAEKRLKLLSKTVITDEYWKTYALLQFIEIKEVEYSAEKRRQNKGGRCD